MIYQTCNKKNFIRLFALVSVDDIQNAMGEAEVIDDPHAPKELKIITYQEAFGL